MPFNADVITLTLIALLAALVIGIVAYAVSAKAALRRTQRDITSINATIIDYFRRSGVQVACDSTRLAGRNAFTAVVESEPMKRFRLSHIIEMTLREHVRKNCGLQLEKVYWRFPIKETASPATGEKAADASPDAGKAEQSPDDYINEGLEHYRHIPKPEVTELDWETFEQVSTLGRGKDEQQGNP